MRLCRLDRFLIAACLWGLAALILSIALEPSPENLTLGVSIILSGLYTGFLYLARPLWLDKLAQKPLRGAILLGTFNAALIETLFLGVEKIFGASGVAAHPNLLVDLIITMPWYIGMVWIFVGVQQKERFSTSAVLLLGAVYELGADGLIGGLILPSLMGSPPDLLEFLILMPLAAFWQFIPVYSSLVLPPAWVLEAGLPQESPSRHRLSRGLLPLLWLIPYLVYAIVILILIAMLTGS
jgi:hypothetical protein